jgi:hypothetical protein
MNEVRDKGETLQQRDHGMIQITHGEKAEDI